MLHILLAEDEGGCYELHMRSSPLFVPVSPIAFLTSVNPIYFILQVLLHVIQSPLIGVATLGISPYGKK